MLAQWASVHLHSSDSGVEWGRGKGEGIWGIWVRLSEPSLIVGGRSGRVLTVLWLAGGCSQQVEFLPSFLGCELITRGNP